MSIVTINLATVCIQSALYGVFLVLALTSLVVLTRQHHMHTKSQLNTSSLLLLPWRSPLFIATVILLLNVTANWIIIVYRAFQAFVHFQSGTNPTGFYAQINTSAVVLNVLPTVTVITCDLTVIYRTWVIWNRRHWVAVLPLLTTTALLVTSINIIVIIGRQKSRTTDTLTPWFTPSYVFTLTNNLYGTGMITYRIVSVDRALRQVSNISGGRRIRQLLGIFVESAALYAAWTLFYFITYITKGTINALANDCFPAVSGIALMLITVRVGLGWAHRGSPMSVQSAASASFIRSALARGERTRDALPLHTITLNVSTTVEQETDFAISPHDTDKRSAEEGAESVETV